MGARKGRREWLKILLINSALVLLILGHHAVLAQEDYDEAFDIADDTTLPTSTSSSSTPTSTIATSPTTLPTASTTQETTLSSSQTSSSTAMTPQPTTTSNSPTTASTQATTSRTTTFPSTPTSNTTPATTVSMSSTVTATSETTTVLPNSTSTATTSSSTQLTSATTSVTSTTPNSTTPSDDEGLPGWAIALIVVACLAVVVILLGLLFIRHRRSRIPMAIPIASVSSVFKKSEKQNNSLKLIPVEDFRAQYKARLAQDLLAEEFERVQEHSARLNAVKTRDVGQMEVNRNRNRFVDIIPFDDNYVKLEHEQGQPPSTYINASYIENIPGVRKVIATQGPKQNTVVEFWRMVMEKNCRRIINLTNLMEGGRIKCHQYWPSNGHMLHFDDISLFTKEEVEIYPGLFRRTIEVQLGEMAESDTRVVEQLHLTSWPDHGVPNTPSSLLAFLRVAEEFQDREYLIVHCSAGVGRTGTYLALSSLLKQARTNNTVNIFKTVMELRSRRPKLVQTQEQYFLLYQVVDLYLKQEQGDLDSDDLNTPADDVLDAGIVNFGFEHAKP